MSYLELGLLGMARLEKDIADEMTRLLKELPKDEYENRLFPRLNNLHEFEEMVEWLKQKQQLVNKHPDSKRKFEIMKNFFARLQLDNLYDPKFDELYDDEYKEMKKVSDSDISLDNFRKNKHSRDIHKRIDSICKMYATIYERACRLYFKPLASKISKYEIDSCGAAINEIIRYQPDTKNVLEIFVPHIRNSIDHSDYYYDNKKDAIVFEDRKKPPIELPIEQLRNLCQLAIVNEVCISAAEEYFKEPLWKLIIKDSRKIEQYSKILGIDHDALLKKCLQKGFSIVQICWLLENIVKNRRRG